VNNGQVKNFQLASNHANFDSFDDIVVIVDYKNKTKRQIAYQLKYSQRNKLITETHVSGEGREILVIQEYKESYEKIKIV
jgi:hypothetical protein